jgi:hypothetical protein
MVAKTHLRLVAPTTEKQTVAPDMIRRRPTALSRAPDGGRSRAPDRRRERRPLGPSRQRDDLGRLSLLALIPALTASITVPQLGSPMLFSLLRIALGAGFGPGLSHSFFAGFGSLNHWIAWLGLEPARDWRPLAGSLLARRSYHDAPIAPNKYASPRVVCLLFAQPRRHF